ncbi:ABC transporter substrate-binding protein [Microbacterium betulae]|uniref:ABC transporter substrate-binding protein n=1 Tax=Microbacterium betulae TaxID=2981139 RepID=A0AA97FG41_9MICO|nr:ABC transporter substrate-binding protein [Microbacterium sp. AB]WOF22911.1 ABC transporter substrate-binding protein [Microbacterium sp. AB]
MTIPRPAGRRPRAAALGILAASALLLSACSGEPQADASADAPVEGGTLRIAIDADPICLDPTQSNLIASGVIGRQIVDSLVDQDPETGDFVPWLAESWEISEDATEYSFVLRSGITFSDGTPLTAQSVKASYEHVLEDPGKTATGAAFLSGYAETAVEDDTHLTVRFEKPNAAFLAGAASRSLGILSAEAIATPYDDRCLGEGLIGSGPFVFDEYVAGESARLVAREDYDWATGLAGHDGRAYVDAVEYSVSAEPSVRTGALQSDQVDIATTIQSQDEATLDGTGFPVLSRVNPGVVTAIAPNIEGSTVLQDDDVREAIQLAIDRQEIADVVLTPSYGVATSVLGETTPGYTDLSEELQTDADAAARILDEAGWVVGDDGIREKDGERLSVSVLYFYQPNVYEYLQQQLRAVGIELELLQVTAAEFTSAATAGDYDLRQASFSRPDPDILRTVFSTSLSNSAFLDPADEAVATLDALLDEQRTIADTADRWAVVSDAQELIVEQNWAFPLAQLVQVVGTSEKVEGLRFDSFSLITLYDVSLTS